MTHQRFSRRVITAGKSDGGVPQPPPERGPLVYDTDIPALYFDGLPGIKNKVRWIRKHLPSASRISIGRRSAWYERDILTYLESLRGAKARP